MSKQDVFAGTAGTAGTEHFITLYWTYSQEQPER